MGLVVCVEVELVRCHFEVVIMVRWRRRRRLGWSRSTTALIIGLLFLFLFLFFLLADFRKITILPVRASVDRGLEGAPLITQAGDVILLLVQLLQQPLEQDQDYL